MGKARTNYESMDREQLIAVIDYQHEELIKQEAITREYQKQLQEAIEYYSIERYRATVQRNREAAGTAPQYGSSDPKSFNEKLIELSTDSEITPVAWRQSNKEVDSETIQCEVTLEFNKPLRLKADGAVSQENFVSSNDYFSAEVLPTEETVE